MTINPEQPDSPIFLPILGNMRTFKTAHDVFNFLHRVLPQHIENAWPEQKIEAPHYHTQHHIFQGLIDLANQGLGRYNFGIKLDENLEKCGCFQFVWTEDRYEQKDVWQHSPNPREGTHRSFTHYVRHCVISIHMLYAQDNLGFPFTIYRVWADDLGEVKMS